MEKEKKSDDDGSMADDEFSEDPPASEAEKEGEYIHDPVPQVSARMYHGSATYSNDGELITAMEMAQLTFHGEAEFREKIRVEIRNNFDKECAHVLRLCRSASVEGSAWFTYDQSQWSEWLRKGPELSKGTSDMLARRKTRMRETMILEALKWRLETEGYHVEITRPYRGSDSDKDYLYVQWSRPKPSMTRGRFWRSAKACIRLTILFSVVIGFLTTFMVILSFTLWLLYTRWEKLDLL
jgi:hypothetical protein